MKNSKLILLGSLILILVTQCSKPEPEQLCGDKFIYIETNSYVLAYYGIAHLSMSANPEQGYIVLHCKQSGKDIYQWREGNDKLRFDSLCAVHNDTGYHKDLMICVLNWEDDSDPVLVEGQSAPDDDINSISIVTSYDFDPNHPAGSSVNDILNIELTSIYPFIQHGYVNEERLGVKVAKKLSEMQVEDYYLILYQIGLGPLLKFDAQPATAGQYKFVYNITMGGGRTFKGEFVYRFE